MGESLLLSTIIVHLFYVTEQRRRTRLRNSHVHEFADEFTRTVESDKSAAFRSAAHHTVVFGRNVLDQNLVNVVLYFPKVLS